MGILELLDPEDDTRKILQNITTYLPGDMANNTEDFKQETCVQYCHSASRLGRNTNTNRHTCCIR
jgi:hypothetical protein